MGNFAEIKEATESFNILFIESLKQNLNESKTLTYNQPVVPDLKLGH